MWTLYSFYIGPLARYDKSYNSDTPSISLFFEKEDALDFFIKTITFGVEDDYKVKYDFEKDHIKEKCARKLKRYREKLKKGDRVVALDERWELESIEPE